MPDSGGPTIQMLTSCSPTLRLCALPLLTGLAVGRKRWLLYPPSQTPPGGGSGPNAVPTFPITFWLTDVYPKLDGAHRPIECMQ